MSNLLDAVKSNLIAGGAYSLIIKALIVTVIITLVAWVIAAALGAVFSYFMCYNFQGITALSEGLSFLFRSTPVLLLLLFLDYGIFSSSHLSKTVMAAIGIGLYGAGHVAEIIMKSLREHEDFSNKEIRRRLKKAFFNAALPEGARRSMFPLKRLSIQLLQWTTVAGYIGVNELTEVMQGIGNRTMYPFFSISFSIIIYVIVTILIELVFAFLEKKFK